MNRDVKKNLGHQAFININQMAWFNMPYFNKSQWSPQWFGRKSTYQRGKKCHCLFPLEEVVSYYVSKDCITICLSQKLKLFKQCNWIIGDQLIRLNFNVVNGTHEMLEQSGF